MADVNDAPERWLDDVFTHRVDLGDGAHADVAVPPGGGHEFATATDPIPHFHDRRIEQLVQRALREHSRRAQELRQALLGAAREPSAFVRQQKLRQALERHLPGIARTLAATELAGILIGMQLVTDHVPEAVTAAAPPLIPQPPWTAVGAIPAGQPPHPVNLPLIEGAVQDLRDRQVLTKQEYQELDATARRKAFTVAGDLGQRAIEKIRTELAEVAARGETLEEFGQRVESAVGEGAFLSPQHMETVFRANVYGSYSEGMERILDKPIVGALFPYVQYFAIHDDRARPEHLALERLGIQGTNVYRRDDIVWKKFRPPWDWNCVPGDTPILTNRGPIPICNVAKGDSVWTHRGRWRRVIGTHCNPGPDELVAIHFKNGVSACLTGNHRVLTESGWIEAAALNVGQKVLQIVELSAFNSAIGEVEDALQAERTPQRCVPLATWPGSLPLNFDADGQAKQVEVQPVRRRAAVELECDAEPLQEVGDGRFVTGHLGAGVRVSAGVDQMSGLSACDHLGADIGSAGGADDAVSIADLSGSLRMQRVMQFLGFGAFAKGSPAVPQDAHERPVLDTGCPGDVPDTGRSFTVRSNGSLDAPRPRHESCLGSEAEGSGTARLCDSHDYNCTFVAVEITGLSRVQWSGENVFNLSVQEDESYVAAGIVMHNCRCGFSPVSIRRAAELGIKEAIDWLRTGVPPARPAWVPMPSFEPSPGWRTPEVPA